MTAGGLSTAAAIRQAALEQVQRLMTTLDKELTRIEQSEPVDTTAALRIAKTYRQVGPAIEALERWERRAPDEAPPKPQPLGLAAQIAARAESGPETVATNGHSTHAS